MKTRSQLTKSMVVGLLLCLMYYAIVCWFFSMSMYSGRFSGSIKDVILIGSGVAGFEISVWLLMPFSKDVKRALGFLLGINGALCAVTWLLTYHELFFFMFGLVQFFYFFFSSFQEEENAKSHGS